MGLPGSGKTYLSERLQPLLESAWFNADKVRSMAGDWDFSEEGRLRQSLRMKSIADFESHHNRIVICDFVCPTQETRKIFSADITIWLDTIELQDPTIITEIINLNTEINFLLILNPIL